MASLKEIKGRIASVRSTLKITSAMKLVASSKLRHAQEAIENMLPYERRLHAMLLHLMGDADLPGGGDGRPVGTDTALSCVREVRKVVIVAFSSNSSLCGGFNSNAIREAKAAIKGYLASGLSSEDITVWSVGRKMADSMRRFGYPSPEDLTGLSAKPAYEGASALAQKLIDAFLSGKVDRVDLIYNHFASTSSQPTVREIYLPLSVAGASSASSAGGSKGASSAGVAVGKSASESGASVGAADGPMGGRAAEASAASGGAGSAPGDSGKVAGVVSAEAAKGSALVGGAGAAAAVPDSGRTSVDYIVEPSREEVVGELLPLSTRLKVFTTLLDTAAAEHAARTVAMQLATDNANDLLSELTLEYNKGRQQKITSEILDIVGGSVNN